MDTMFTDILDLPFPDDQLAHYGTPRHSGRYPWGSGKNPQRHKNFLTMDAELKKQGLSEKERAQAMGMSTTELRAMKSIASDAHKAEVAAQVIKLRKTGMSFDAIAQETGVSASSARNMVKEDYAIKLSSDRKLAEVLKEQVEQHPYLDIGAGVERQLGVSDTKLKTAVKILEQEGYSKKYLKVEQAGNPGQFTTVMVLAKDNVTYEELREHKDQIISPQGVFSNDGGNTFLGIKPPVSIDSKRIDICYAEQGGTEKDGLIEIRPGVPDISLGDNRYAQVRIAVDGTHYLKGMAVYNDKLPDGVDIRFNTNKDSSKSKMEVLKEMNTIKATGEVDMDNPFGATIRQYEYEDEKGNKHLSAINIVNNDEDWAKWSKTLSSQMLSKQSPALAKQQLDITYDRKKQEFNEIMALTNPVLKKHLLESFADGCDSAAVDLKAAALPRQATKVLIPMPSLKDDEIFAPSYNNGEQVVLIRYPHGGTFEIPTLTVNNKAKEGIDTIGKDARNAVGINAKVAERLSGADFDGDTVTVIPIVGQKIKTSNALEGLKDFDPKHEYRAYEGMPKTCKENGFQKQMEMGKVSNLITDMTIRGATEDEIARAVRHSMVVIDAEKHNLDWKRSYQENRIAELKEKYQGGANKGASTLISQASSDTRVNERKSGYKIDPDTGEKIYTETGRTYKTEKVMKDGSVKTEIHKAQEKSTKMAEASDAFELSSGTRIENVYATHANKLKALANEARKAYVATENPKRNPTAAKEYAPEVSSLLAKLNIALKNAPNERKAQLVASKVVETKIEHNPELKDDDEHLSRVRRQALAEARARSGALSRKERNIDITDREWEAIQANAISPTQLKTILSNTDLDKLKERATPRNNKSLNSAALSRARSLLNRGYTWAEVSEQVGISVSTLQKQI